MQQQQRLEMRTQAVTVAAPAFPLPAPSAPTLSMESARAAPSAASSAASPSAHRQLLCWYLQQASVVLPPYTLAELLAQGAGPLDIAAELCQLHQQLTKAMLELSLQPQELQRWSKSGAVLHKSPTLTVAATAEPLAAFQAQKAILRAVQQLPDYGASYYHCLLLRVVPADAGGGGGGGSVSAQAGGGGGRAGAGSGSGERGGGETAALSFSSSLWSTVPPAWALDATSPFAHSHSAAPSPLPVVVAVCSSGMLYRPFYPSPASDWRAALLKIQQQQREKEKEVGSTGWGSSSSRAAAAGGGADGGGSSLLLSRRPALSAAAAAALAVSRGLPPGSAALLQAPQPWLLHSVDKIEVWGVKKNRATFTMRVREPAGGGAAGGGLPSFSSSSNSGPLLPTVLRVVELSSLSYKEVASTLHMYVFNLLQVRQGRQQDSRREEASDYGERAREVKERVKGVQEEALQQGVQGWSKIEDAATGKVVWWNQFSKKTIYSD